MEQAFLGNQNINYTFKFNPQSASWGYQQNVGTFDTIGGRVYQLLSVSPTTLTVQGQAGSREELQVMAKQILGIMNYHINSQSPVQFVVPTRKWNFAVYVVAMPQIGWDYTTVVYPYQLQLSIEEDFGITTQDILTNQIDLLASQIGFTTTFEGGSPADFQKIVKQVTQGVAIQGGAVGPGYSGVITIPGNPSSQAKKAVLAAYGQIGVHYHFGWESPKGSANPGFDCSGLTQWCWKQAGVSISRTSETQFAEFPTVAKVALQPGDLVYFYYPGDGQSAPNHVGIYIGNGNMIDAPVPGQNVSIGPVDWGHYYGANRPG